MYIALLILGIILTVWFFVSQEKTRKKLQKKTGEDTFHKSTTTQGGSNYGQGSSYLGPSSYKQGAEKTTGADYHNESGKLSETDKTDQ